jgi:hypothetical protein
MITETIDLLYSWVYLNSYNVNLGLFFIFIMPEINPLFRSKLFDGENYNLKAYYN